MAVFRNIVLTGALTLGIATPALFAIAGLGAKYGLWDWRFGLLTLTRQVGPILAIGAIIVALAALVMALTAPRSRGLPVALLALALPAATLVRLDMVRRAARDIPPIHDIATDYATPIRFSEAMMQARGPTANPVKDAPEFNGRPLAEIVGESYPKLRPIVLDMGPEAASAAVVTAMQSLGWSPYVLDQDQIQIEASETSFWYGFVDDVAVTVAPTPDGGSILQMRSVSRVGQSDLGANAKRLEKLGEAIQNAAGATGSAP
ncbi:MAG TPA: hypothetical protein DCZ49_01835 [Hyphomonadaceae bacterium]|nr:hypothetical protein [Hyphomonadaceae bacterium]